MKAQSSYVDLLMQEWRMGEASLRIQTCVRRVLGELDTEALLILRNEPKLEVMVTPETGLSVWAFFPFRRGRFLGKSVWTVPKELKVRVETGVVLAFNPENCEHMGATLLQDQLRDHFGHILLFLRNPKAPNDCPDAQREWRRSLG